MVYFYFLILFVMHCSFEACNPAFPIELLTLIGDCNHDLTIRDIEHYHILNKYNLFGSTRHDFFKLFRIKTPSLFLTCKRLYAPLVIAPHMPDGLEEQLRFLTEFKFSQKRKWFAWQVLADRYFNRYGGLINQRNKLLTSSALLDSSVLAFHATIDFHTQNGCFIDFNRNLEGDNNLWYFDQKCLDLFIKKTRDPEFAERSYVDIGFLTNFNWISDASRKNPAYQPITLHDQCLISYLASALDVDFRCQQALNQNVIQDFLQTNESQKKFISLLKKIKKKIKTETDSHLAKKLDRMYIMLALGTIFGKKPNSKQLFKVRSKTALIDCYFIAGRFAKRSDPELDYVLIKAAHKYCNNKNERENFIANFEKTLTSFAPFVLTVLESKKPNRLLQMPLWLQAQILKLPQHYFVQAQYFFYAGTVFAGLLVMTTIALLMIKIKLLSKHSL